MSARSETGLWEAVLRKPPELAVRPALVARGGSLSHDDLLRLVRGTAASLRGAGVEDGDRVLLLLPNSPEFVVAFLAVTAAGGIAVSLDALAGPGRVAGVLEDTAPKLCLRPADRELPEDLGVASVAIRIDMDAKGVDLDPAPGNGAAASPLPAVDGSWDAAILFSAGSTGRPKGSVLKQRHFLKIAQTLVDILELNAEHRDLIVAPMTHSGGWQRVTSTLLAGGCAVVPDGPITIQALLEDLRDHKINGFFAPPPLLRVLLTMPEERVRAASTALHSIESASAPLSADELSRLMNLLPNTDVFFQYGLTECSRAFILDTRAHPDKLHTVGLPTQGVKVKIVGEDGRECGPDEEGEIRLAAEQLTEGYWNRSDLDQERLSGGWLRTGDVGTVDREGFLTYRGRKDDMINCGGLSYFPAEVENELGSVEGVEQYLVAGVPDPQGILGQVPWAFVVPEDPEAWSPKGFTMRARGRLPAHMIPRRVVAIPSMPLLRSGKPDRRTMLERYGPANPGGAER